MKAYKMIIILSFILASCGSGGSRWVFKLLDGNVRTYYASEWTCYHNESENYLYVECFSNSSYDMNSFYAVSMEYKSENINE